MSNNRNQGQINPNSIMNYNQNQNNNLHSIFSFAQVNETSGFVQGNNIIRQNQNNLNDGYRLMNVNAFSSIFRKKSQIDKHLRTTLHIV